LQYYLDNFATVQEAADRFVRAAYCLMHLPQLHHGAGPWMGAELDAHAWHATVYLAETWS